MSDTLSYADAVRLLGGEKSRFVDWFDRLTAVVPVPPLLGVLDVKAFVKLGHELLRGVAEKRSELSRYGRTRRLEAAHAVIVVTAFFDVLAEFDLPFDLSEARIVKAEQLSLAGAGAVDARALTDAFFSTAAPVPGPHLPYTALHDAVTAFYGDLADRLARFLSGLTMWDRLTREQQAFLRYPPLPMMAAERYADLLTELAVDFPEVSFWLGRHEHEATREQVRGLAVGFVELRRALAELSTGRAPDDRRADLARAYAAELGRPVISSGDVPAGLTVPTLCEAYVPPLCRIAELNPEARPGEETWWEGQPVRDDLWQALVVHLASSRAVRAPLLVLGQPGSGKSVLTRVVAAQLPAADFFVVRVVLRDVYAAGELQDQIEQAVRRDTGERTDWPALSRAAGDALPVVLLDGFDELLQATGVSQTDYLRRVAAFQRREADQGRPVAVVVTSRTSVADRAQPPPDTVAVRLEPFDYARVSAWVQTWNRVNAGALRAQGGRPLDLATVLRHRELAEQPLLLLMLALYDAEGNELGGAGGLRRGELYERLLRRFARREAVKQRDGLPEAELDRAVEAELRRLAVVAFAMFNRRAQWVTETELDADLSVLPFGESATAGDRAGLRVPLRAAEVVLGRFFFIHRSRASVDEQRRETYEFLHATFGEYLVARLTAQVVEDMVAREAATSLSWGGEPVDDDLLHALLSYAVLSTRSTVLAFLAERLEERDHADRYAWRRLLLRLFRAAPYRVGVGRFDDYRPRRLPVPARYAAYGANLLLLALVGGGEVDGRAMFPESTDPVAQWRSQVGLWRSQLDPEEWDSLGDGLALDRGRDGNGRNVLVRWGDRFAAPPAVDLTWTHGASSSAVVPPWSDRRLARLRRSTHLLCDADLDVLAHTLEPFFDKLPTALGAFAETEPGVLRSPAHTLLDAWLLPLRPATTAARKLVYLRAARAAVQARQVAKWDRSAYLRLLVERLTGDPDTPARLASEVLFSGGAELFGESGHFRAVFRGVAGMLGVDERVDRRLAGLVEDLLDVEFHVRDGGPGEQLIEVLVPVRGETPDAQAALVLDEEVVDVLVRLHELEVRTMKIAPTLASDFLARYRRRRPDLVERISPLRRGPG
ncbi:NACHT domain-containing protein [Micromonospora sp. NPDC000089]|uniref:NACHT domain-containing protein n=1 Tax=unclassified Micromonospora TaxID=2617518 RepID=UPI00368C33A6